MSAKLSLGFGSTGSATGSPVSSGCSTTASASTGSPVSRGSASRPSNSGISTLGETTTLAGTMFSSLGSACAGATEVAVSAAQNISAERSEGNMKSADYAAKPPNSGA
jgi:hypothetical protein